MDNLTDSAGIIRLKVSRGFELWTKAIRFQILRMARAVNLPAPLAGMLRKPRGKTSTGLARLMLSGMLVMPCKC